MAMNLESACRHFCGGKKAVQKQLEGPDSTVWLQEGPGAWDWFALRNIKCFPKNDSAAS